MQGGNEKKNCGNCGDTDALSCTGEFISAKKASPLPYYGAGAVWLVSAVLFPMYYWWHFAVIAVVSLVSFFAIKALVSPAEARLEPDEYGFLREKSEWRVFFTDSKIAATLSAAVIVLCAFCGFAGSAYILRAEVTESFAGEDSICAFLDGIVTESEAIEKTAAEKLGDTDLLSGSIAQLVQASTPSGKYAAAQELSTVLKSVRAALSKTETAQEETDSLEKHFRAADALYEKISLDPYNSEAEEFNDIVDSFPGFVFAYIMGVERIEQYSAEY